jgi:hypothetical protein
LSHGKKPQKAAQAPHTLIFEDNMSFENLQVGDKVFITSAGFRQQLATVDRLTTTQVVVGKSKYSKATGRLVGGSGWHCQHLYLATEQQIAEYQEDQLRRRLINHIVNTCDCNKLRQLETSKLKEIVAVISTIVGEKHGAR